MVWSRRKLVLDALAPPSLLSVRRKYLHQRAMVWGTVFGQVGVIVASVLGLWLGARLLVDSAVRLARRAGLSELAIGLTVVAIGTSTPELVVTVDAALTGASDIAVGNVVGSNIYNLAFILGVVSLFRVVPIERSLVHRDGLALVASTLVGFAAMRDLTVGRAEGLLLVGLLVVYTGYLFRAESGGDVADDGESSAEASSNGGRESPETTDSGRDSTDAFAVERNASWGRDAVPLVVGLAVVLVSGHYMVEAATALARGAGVSEWVIGGTIVAAGTSTPEFAVSLVALRRGRLGVSVGNVVGSNLFNLFGILGLGALIRPLAVSGAAIESMAWLTVVVVVMVAALWSGRRLSRAEGGLFALSEAVRWALGLAGITG
ncbi:calcium/sodium antiporter [Halorussus limi]|uniref:Calcium/sodium antiporter n=2 Tax=Halorussus limi TaxID=2938695 RepID=A0A8U0HU56_9EURY|nr:calcium/sodium antiporter [Halorussus limi]UPV74437.1 calcium/sodium antiporter [Halorussus limi]